MSEFKITCLYRLDVQQFMQRAYCLRVYSVLYSKVFHSSIHTPTDIKIPQHLHPCWGSGDSQGESTTGPPTKPHIFTEFVSPHHFSVSHIYPPQLFFLSSKIRRGCIIKSSPPTHAQFSLSPGVSLCRSAH